jgi:hypothetical protein
MDLILADAFGIVLELPGKTSPRKPTCRKQIHAINMVEDFAVNHLGDD